MYGGYYNEKMEFVEVGDIGNGIEVISKPVHTADHWEFVVRDSQNKQERTFVHYGPTLPLSYRVLNDRRMGEIALKLARHRLQKSGISLTPQFRREIGNDAKSIGIPYEDIRRFYEKIIQELTKQMFDSDGREEQPSDKVKPAAS